MSGITVNPRTGDLVYGPNKRYKVYNKNYELSAGFKKRYRAGEVTELPSDYMYNSMTNRFYEKTPKNIKK